jgi:hypothetical protein
MSLFDVAILSSRHNFAIQAGAVVAYRRYSTSSQM